MTAFKSPLDTNTITVAIRELHSQIRSVIRSRLPTIGPQKEPLTPTLTRGHGDVSYCLDVGAEEIVDSFFRDRWTDVPVTVVCEGLGVRTYPEGTADVEASLRILIDPLDGTRELAYDKRSAWILTGVAQNRGQKTTLADIFLAIQTEVAPSKQSCGSMLWAVKGGGVNHEIWDLHGSAFNRAGPTQPSTATTLDHGFAVFVDFFTPGPKRAVSTIAHHVLDEVLGPKDDRVARVFNDQYISTGGQMYLLATGCYRLVVDIRPKAQAGGPGHFMCAHPYDLCTFLIATEAGAIVTDGDGKPLAYPFDTETECSWIGYCNKDIRDSVDSILRRALDWYTH